jgi:hypothetical protein
MGKHIARRIRGDSEGWRVSGCLNAAIGNQYCTVKRLAGDIHFLVTRHAHLLSRMSKSLKIWPSSSAGRPTVHTRGNWTSFHRLDPVCLSFEQTLFISSLLLRYIRCRSEGFSPFKGLFGRSPLHETRVHRIANIRTNSVFPVVQRHLEDQWPPMRSG